jgi:hypothetical protein
MRDAFRHALFAFIILSDLQQRHNGLRYPRWGGRRDAVRLEKC